MSTTQDDLKDNGHIVSVVTSADIDIIVIQSNLPYRSPLSNGHFETHPTNITIKLNSFQRSPLYRGQRSPISCENREIVF